MSMLIALNLENKLVHIIDVERGLACRCTCFTCGDEVIARKGEINEHHFAHASNKDSCIINTESLIHRYGKQVILDSLSVHLPALPNFIDEHQSTLWTFEKVIPEFSFGKIRPDLVAYTNGKPIFIEIAVTHFIDQEKLNFIKKFAVNTVELDLSSLLNSEISIPSDEAKQFILDELSHKKWIYPETTKLNSPMLYQPLAEIPYVDSADINALRSSQWVDFKFTINGMWVDVRKFSSGMLAVKCAYNPEIIAMLKMWRNQGGGKYDPKYKSWKYWQPFSDTVLQRLRELHSEK